MTNNISKQSNNIIDFKKWTNDRFLYASKTIQKCGINTFMTCSSHIIDELNLPKYSSSKLKEFVLKSQIHTFGWPIAVMLENRDEFKSKAKNFGISNIMGLETDICLSDDEDARYDYWALTNQGDFYLLKSLFEDTRRAGVIFVDTRIIRTTECLMFIRNLYEKMEIPNNKKIEIKMTYSGIKDRQLAVASPTRLWFSKKVNRGEDSMEVSFTTSVNDINENMAGLVEELTTPLFNLFDSYIVDGGVLSEIVASYQQGKIS